MKLLINEKVFWRSKGHVVDRKNILGKILLNLKYVEKDFAYYTRGQELPSCRFWGSNRVPGIESSPY